MKRTIYEIFRAIVVGFVMPMLLIGMIVTLSPARAEGQELLPTAATGMDTVIKDPQITQTQTQKPEPVTIAVIVNGEMQTMELEAYVLGVVLGELPSEFHIEAMKAQAVVARTYAMKAASDNSRHNNGAVCTRSNCCQAYRDPNLFLASGGTEKELNKARAAVEETRGCVLTYRNELIAATYFSCSGGTTEEALEVWGYDVPYLQSVKSPGEEGAAGFAKKVTMSGKEFQKKMAIRLSGAPGSWFGKVTYTVGGGVATIEIGGVTYRGTTIRSLLNLRSTMFTISVDKDNIIITTKGYGHRVGMSQYGANAMANSGNEYAQILAHYYPGTELEILPVH